MKAIWKFSVLISLVTAVLSFILSYLQIQGIGSYFLPTILSFVLYIVVFIGAIWYIRKQQSGIISFIRALLITVIITLVSSVFGIASTIAYGSTFTEAEKNQIVDRIVDETLYDNYFSDRDELAYEDQLRKQNSIMFEFSIASVMAMIGMMIFLGIIGLVVALIMKKDPPVGQAQIAGSY